jgi:exonuclease SbcD
MGWIRLIHTGDLHIGVKNYGRINSSTGMHTRLMDFLNSMDQMVEYALRENIHAVLIAGDVFKSREPDATQQMELAKRIKRLSDAGVSVYIITGNHDIHHAPQRAAAVEIYDVLDLPGVYVRRRPTVEVLKTKGGPLQIAALPYMWAGQMAGHETALGEAADVVRVRLKEIIDDLISGIRPELPTVLMAHFSLEGAVPGSEEIMLSGNDAALPVSFFARKEVDYIAMGHIHKYQAFYRQPPVVYCGSMDRVDFNEEKEQKGFVEVKLKRGEARYRFVPLQTRPFVTLHVESKGGSPYEKAVDAIQGARLEDAIVKMKITLTVDQLSHLRENDLYKMLREKAFYIAGIEKKLISDLSHLRHPGISERMDVDKAVARYISEKKEYDAIRDDLIKAHQELMRELRRDEML